MWPPSKSKHIQTCTQIKTPPKLPPQSNLYPINVLDSWRLERERGWGWERYNSQALLCLSQNAETPTKKQEKDMKHSNTIFTVTLNFFIIGITFGLSPESGWGCESSQGGHVMDLDDIPGLHVILNLA